MDNPGYYSLGAFTLTTAGTYGHDVGEELTGLAGMLSATVRLKFNYGSGGTSGKVYLQTSLDQANEGGVPGGSKIDIACMTFATANKEVVLNFSALTPKISAVTPTDGALTDDTALDGVLGDRLSLKIVTTGSAYAGSTQIVGSVVVR